MVDKAGNVKIAGELQNMNGNRLSTFIEKEIEIHSYSYILEESNTINKWISSTDTFGAWVVFCDVKVNFNSTEEMALCDFRIPPMIIPYTNNSNGIPLEYSDDFKNIEFTSLGTDETNLNFKINFNYVFP